MSVQLKQTYVTRMLFVLTLLVATTVPVMMASQEMVSSAVSISTSVSRMILTRPSHPRGSSIHTVGVSATV